MGTHRVKEVKTVRPSLKKYPSVASTNNRMHKKELPGIALLLVVVGSLLFLPHLALAGISATTAAKPVTQSVSDYKVVQAKAGNSAWALIQAANPGDVDMETALEKFRQLNGTIQLKQGFSYKVPIAH